MLNQRTLKLPYTRGIRRGHFEIPEEEQRKFYVVQNAALVTVRGMGIQKKTRWCKTRGRFLSIGAAVMSKRNERASDGLVVDAHLSDGTSPNLRKEAGNLSTLSFVEYHKTRAFTFTSFVEEDSVWNLDGEIFHAHHLSAQVLRGLIPLFAYGPEEEDSRRDERLKIQLQMLFP